MVKDENGEVWLTPKEAAKQLGLSVERVYHLKNKLTHRKGKSKASRLFFLQANLLDDYMNC